MQLFRVTTKWHLISISLNNFLFSGVSCDVIKGEETIEIKIKKCYLKSDVADLNPNAGDDYLC